MPKRSAFSRLSRSKERIQCIPDRYTEASATIGACDFQPLDKNKRRLFKPSYVEFVVS